MTLRAVVYINQKNLPADLFDYAVEVDKVTGEVYSDAREFQIRFPKDMLTATKVELGSIVLVSDLYQKIEAIMDHPRSLVLSKILYSGSHCGDVLPVEDVPTLRKELHQIAQSYEVSKDPAVARLLQQLRLLADKAEEQGNPIVFV